MRATAWASGVGGPSWGTRRSPWSRAPAAPREGGPLGTATSTGSGPRLAIRTLTPLLGADSRPDRPVGRRHPRPAEPRRPPRHEQVVGEGVALQHDEIGCEPAARRARCRCRAPPARGRDPGDSLGRTISRAVGLGWPDTMREGVDLPAPSSPAEPPTSQGRRVGAASTGAFGRPKDLLTPPAARRRLCPSAPAGGAARPLGARHMHAPSARRPRLIRPLPRRQSRGWWAASTRCRPSSRSGSAR
jgi:hypothetical protein